MGTISRQQSLLPFPQYTAVQQVYAPAGNSTYEAGTIQAEKRLSSTLTFLTNYTRSKAIDDVRTPMDIYNRRLEKALSTFDTPNLFRFSGVYNIPFGRDRAHGKDINRFVTAIFGDWDFDGILTIQSGLPVSLNRTTVSTGQSAPVNNGQSAKLSDPSIYKWFNTSVFRVAPAYTYGNAGRNILRGPGFFNLDLAAHKTFKITERFGIQIRTDARNVFNHTNLGTPNSDVQSPSAGQITGIAGGAYMRSLQFSGTITF